MDLPQSARDEIIHNSSASELEMEEKIKKHGPQKKISSILLVPYAPTIAYITICLVVVFITPISIIAGLLSFIVRGVPALIARTGVFR